MHYRPLLKLEKKGWKWTIRTDAVWWMHMQMSVFIFISSWKLASIISLIGVIIVYELFHCTSNFKTWFEIISFATVIMEDSEMEMSKEGFKKWLRIKLKNELFIEVEEKCKMLQSVLDRREKLSVLLLQLCRSVLTLCLSHDFASECCKNGLGPPSTFWFLS